MLCFFGAGLSAADSGRVKLVRTPDGGIQPQAVVDRRGAVHLIYYKGEGSGGDLFYVRREAGQDNFSAPLRVNRQDKSATAAGTIRGAQLAVGKNGRVHVAWNGHPPEKGAWMKAPMLHARLNDAGTAFEPEHDVITQARGLDGGGSVAADEQGNVYVFWHAPKPGNTNGEAGRALFVARSTNEGKAFAPEKLAFTKPTGACGCCGMKGYADQRGHVYALYRAASEKVNRDEVLLVSRTSDPDFTAALADPWKVPTCPMSSASFAESKAGVLAAWETDGKVYFTYVNPETLNASAPLSPPGAAKRKHPAIAGNAQGEVLLVWTEGTGWQKGGAVAWQLFNSEGKPASEKGRADGVPVWSLATTFAQSDGTFVIVY
jgi:hypothetical protein